MNLESYQQIRSELNFQHKTRFILLHAVFDTALIFGILNIRNQRFGPAVSAFVLAALMFRSFSVMHEAVHGSLFKSKALNTCAGIFYGLFCFLPFQAWRKIHLEHHFWTGNLDRDPTMKIIKNHRDQVQPATRAQDWFWKAWLPYFAWRQQIVFWQTSLSEAKGWARLGVVAQGLMSLAVLGMAGWLFGPVAAIAGLFLYLLIIELVNFPHHMDLPQQHDNFRVGPSAQHAFCRTCVYSSWFSKYVLLNFNYHVEHHLFPDLPYHQLPLAHAKVATALGEQYHVSYGNDWIKKSRREGLIKVIDRCIDWTQFKKKNVG